MTRRISVIKNMTIWQRLNTALAVLVLLLLAGGGLALWIEKSSSDAVRRNDELDQKRDQIFFQFVVMSDSLRGLLLEPSNGGEKKRRVEAENAFVSNLKGLTNSFPEESLRHPVETLLSYCTRTFFPLQRSIPDQAEANRAASLAEYSTNYTDVQRQLTSLAQRIGDLKTAESVRARTTSVVGASAIVVILFACIVVGRFQSSAVTVPLNRVVSGLERMRQGDFTERLKMERRDEFGEVSDGLDRLADDLSSLVGQVQRSGIQVNTAATEIAATAREQQSTANEIAATTAQIGATSKEISATSKELVKTMNEVTQVAEETGNLAGSGQSAIGRMEATMRQIMEASGSITAKLAVLSEKTTNINSVVTTITKVADQTNLLSLNAAIEAEKAGEYGLGFAVVAMEIRRLADQTAVATYDIEKMVKEMQSAVAAGVMGMDKFSDQVRRGVEEIRQVSTQLAQIINQVQTLTPRFQTVNEGMHAQATGAQQISETLTQLSEAASQTADSLRQSNLAIEQLNGAARGLQTSVARFKLGNGA